MVRVDEHLRMKLMDLQQANYDVEGWTPLAEQENLENKRMIVSMRSFLNMIGVQYFQTQLLSNAALEEIRKFPNESDFVEPNERKMRNVSEMRHEELQFFLKCFSDKKNTKRFFKQLARSIYTTDCGYTEEELNDIVEAVVNNVEFSPISLM